MTDPVDDASYADVDAALYEWRQGDCVLATHWFVFRTDLTRPITPAGRIAAGEGFDTAESEVLGLMVLTQTCDLVRSSKDRPYIEVCPIVLVDEVSLGEIRGGRRPNYASIEALTDRCLVADLDRVMTVEKSVVSVWKRIPGWSVDLEGRRLAAALARKRSRVAFPDDFVAAVAPLVQRLSSKHDKNSVEGHALRALREIRVRAAPSWDAAVVELTIWFIRADDEACFDGRGWDTFLDDWCGRIAKSERFLDVQGLVLTLDDLSARAYVESDRLDLDHLTIRAK